MHDGLFCTVHTCTFIDMMHSGTTSGLNIECHLHHLLEIATYATRVRQIYLNANHNHHNYTPSYQM
jgi:hypothetical protein